MLKAADLRRIQRCREQGFSKGRTAEMLGFSRVTVRKYWSAVDCVVAPRKSAPRTASWSTRFSVNTARARAWRRCSAKSTGSRWGFAPCRSSWSRFAKRCAARTSSIS